MGTVHPVYHYVKVVIVSEFADYNAVYRDEVAINNNKKGFKKLQTKCSLEQRFN
uniref:Uncharacterized protein n=1 Tax=Tetranychus urticae TaxID=32264 RepID=T1KEP3_TETUR